MLKTLVGHIGVFLVHQLVAFQELKGDVKNTHNFLHVLEVFGCWFLNPFFLFLPLCFFELSSFGFLFSDFCFRCCCFINHVSMLWLLLHVVLGFCCFRSFFSCGFCFVFWYCLCVFWGFKGQVRWPQGPPHLTLNPPYLFWFLLFCFFWGGVFLFCVFVRL